MPTSFYSNLQSRIRGLLPPRLQTVGDFHFFCFISCSTFFLGLLCPWMAWLGLTVIAKATGIAAVICALLGVARLRGLDLPIASQFYQTTLISVVLYSTWHMGGLSSPAMVWLGIVPLLPWFTMSRGWTFAWLMLAFFSVWAFLGFHLWGWLPIKEGYSLVDLLVSATMYGLLCLTQGILLVTLDTADADNLKAMEQTAQELSQANAKLLEASRHKDQFLAMVSHAMRTPLNGVKGYLGLLGDRRDLNPEAQQEVAGAQNAASHLLTVINDLLDLSQISQGRFSLSPQVIQLPDAVRDIFRTLASHAHGLDLSYRLNIEPDVPTWVKLDPDRLAQILINLLGNAIKFTPQGGVVLTVSVANGSAPRPVVLFAVQDSGTGIEPEQLSRIFEPFYQAHHQSLRPDDESLRGNGLGLAISQGLAHAMGGSLQVRSRVGEGSCFTLEVPLTLAAAPVIHPSDPEAHTDALDRHPYRILLVDDQSVNRAVLAATLKKMLPNAHLAQADGGISALEHLHSHDCDLVLIDLIMPDMAGIEVVRRTRQFKDPHRRDVPFIALTANVAQEAVTECLAVGMVEVMPKPFNRQGLLRAIQNHARHPAQATAHNA
jgi:signal transduction histidine kinase/CheY-like chemotaxis protein